MSNTPSRNVHCAWAVMTSNSYLDGIHGIYRTREEAQEKASTITPFEAFGVIGHGYVKKICIGEVSSDIGCEYSSDLGYLVTWSNMNYMFQKPSWMKMSAFL